MINEDKLEQDIENWLVDVGGGFKDAGVSYFTVLFKGVKEALSIGYMGRKDRQQLTIRLVVHVTIIAVLIMKTETITVIMSDFLSQYLKGFLSKLLYQPLITEGVAALIGLNYFYGIGLKKQLEEDEMSELFEEIKFFTGKKKMVVEGDKKVMVPATPKLIRKIDKDADTRIYMFQSKGILPAEWEKRKAQLEYILEGKIINMKRGKKKSMKLVIVTEEKFEEMTEFYRRMEAFDENFERMNLVGKGTREVEMFGEVLKTKNFPQFIEESDETINGKLVLTTTFKSSGLTLGDFKVKRYEYENVMNRLVVEMNQDKINKQLYRIRTIDTKDELKEIYNWSNDIIDERDGVLVLGEGRLAKVILDLNQTPHILVGGVTGSGKSVEMNCLIYQGIKKGWYPILVDFKGGLELGMFKDYSDFGVLFEAKKVLEVLKQLNKEHNARLEEFKKYPGVKNIVDYNERVPEELRLARIILGIDEVGELLDASGKSKADKAIIEAIEGEINSLARLSRSTGINILTGTQRPDSNVLKGQIKNNLGARICGRMTDKEPSIMVLGSPDATKLPEDVKGRYMFSVGSDPTIMQGYYFKESDIEKGDFLKGRLLTISTGSKTSSERDGKENGPSKSSAEPYEDFENHESSRHEESGNDENLTDVESEDKFLEDAIQFVIQHQSASVSNLQRKYRIGYNRAARMMDVMEERGIVGPSNGSEPRVVMIKEENLTDTNEKKSSNSPEENYQAIMTELIHIIESSDKLTTRALLTAGTGLETALELLKDIYDEQLVGEKKLSEIKVILFKEGKLSNEEYSKRSNAEPII